MNPMSPYLLRKHLFLDGYTPDQARTEDLSTMDELLAAVNRFLFNGAGITQNLAISADDHPENNGLSGIVLGPGGHFTCHTFSHRSVVFADCYVRRPYDQGEIQRLLLDAFAPHHIQRCRNDYGSGFGRHLVLRLPHWTADQMRQIPDAIIAATQMKPLGSLMMSANAAQSRQRADLVRPITTSHIAAHATAAGVTLDVFSCQVFSEDVVIQTLTDLGLPPREGCVLSRGISVGDRTL